MNPGLHGPARERDAPAGPEAGPGAAAEPPWMRIARAEIGVRACGPGQSNARITAYHAGTNIAGYDDKAAWCSSFVHWCLAQADVAGTGSALARSWLSWGQPLDAPCPVPDVSSRTRSNEEALRISSASFTEPETSDPPPRVARLRMNTRGS